MLTNIIYDVIQSGRWTWISSTNFGWTTSIPIQIITKPNDGRAGMIQESNAKAMMANNAVMLETLSPNPESKFKEK
jgi:hypothetical protein